MSTPKRKGGKVVAEGAYGCVVSPPPKCSTTPTSKNTVAKLFDKEQQLDEEYALAKKVSKMDKDGRWSIRVHDTCKLRVKDLAPEDREGCNITSSMRAEDLVSFMVMDYGGPSLEMYINQRMFLELKEFCFIFETCLSGMIMMHAAGFMHLDIKPGNILYDKEAKKCYLIDFSLMKPMGPSFFSSKNGFLFDAHYMWYPPEFSIVATRSLFSYSPQDIKHMLTKAYGVKVLNEKEIGFMTYEVLDFITALQSRGNNDTWQTMNHAYMEVLPKIDVFSLGLTMIQLYRSCVDKNTRIASVEDIMMGMVRGNVFDRTKAYDAYATLMKVIKTRFQVDSLMVAPTSAASSMLYVADVTSPKTPTVNAPSHPNANLFTDLFKKKS